MSSAPPKPNVPEPEWELVGDDTPLSDAAVEVLASLLIDAAERAPKSNDVGDGSERGPP